MSRIERQLKRRGADDGLALEIFDYFETELAKMLIHLTKMKEECCKKAADAINQKG